MNDPHSLLATLSRPTLLVTAAQLAATHYSRDRTLRTLLGGFAPKGPGETLMALIVVEQALEENRRSRYAGYSVARHVGVLAALIAEGRILADRPARVQAKASATSALRRAT